MQNSSPTDRTTNFETGRALAASLRILREAETSKNGEELPSSNIWAKDFWPCTRGQTIFQNDIDNVLTRGAPISDDDLQKLLTTLNDKAVIYGFNTISVQDVRKGISISSGSQPINGATINGSHSKKVIERKPVDQRAPLSFHPERLKFLVCTRVKKPMSKFCLGLGLCDGAFGGWKAKRLCPARVADELGVQPHELLGPLTPEEQKEFGIAQRKLLEESRAEVTRNNPTGHPLRTSRVTKVAICKDRIELLRLTRKLTQRDIDTALGSHPGCYAIWMESRSVPQKLLDFFGVTPENALQPLSGEESEELEILKKEALARRIAKQRTGKKPKVPKPTTPTEKAETVPATQAIPAAAEVPQTPVSRLEEAFNDPTIQGLVARLGLGGLVLLAANEFISTLEGSDKVFALNFLRHKKT